MQINNLKNKNYELRSMPIYKNKVIRGLCMKHFIVVRVVLSTLVLLFYCHFICVRAYLTSAVK